MTDWVYAAVPQYGVALLFVLTFLSCLALPVPASLVMLAAGAFVATGDLELFPVMSAAWAGAVLGDQLGFAVGRWGGTALWARLEARPAMARLLTRARLGLQDRGASTVYLSRWLFSALGPWVNLAAGPTGMRWRLFSVAGTLGEATWVALYVGLGFVFAANIRTAGETMISVIGALGAGIVALLVGRMLWRMRARQKGAGEVFSLARQPPYSLHVEISSPDPDAGLRPCDVPLFGLADIEDAGRAIASTDRQGPA